MALAPGLARKVKKVLETSLESPEILSCLRSLSEFYPENTPEARRGLRRSVEQHGLSINREYLTASLKAQVALRAVDGQLERLLGSCDVISSALERTRERTGELLRETASLDGEIASIEEKQQIVQTFAVDFQLTDEDVAALEGTVTGTSTGTDTTSDSNQIDTKFFTALTRARTIHGNCKRLLRTHHQRAGLELMDQMSSYQEKAHERLCRWVQRECRSLAEEDGGEDVDETLTRAMTALKHRPTLFKYCVEEVARTRHNALFRRFITALTKGGPGGVPKAMEHQQSDPVRFVGDMLAWLHQAVCGERELVGALLGGTDGGDDGADDGNDDQNIHGAGGNKNRVDETTETLHGPSSAVETSSPEAETNASEVLDRILDGIKRPFRVRVDQALTGQSGESEIVRYKLAGLFSFYGSILQKICGDGGSLVSTLKECHALALDAFEQTVALRAERLVKHPPVVNDDLSAPDCVLETTRRVVELLSATQVSSSAFEVDDTTGEPIAVTSVRAMLVPVATACELSAETLVSDASYESTHENKHPRYAKRAFLVNCFGGLLKPLREFPDAAGFVSDFDTKADTLLHEMARTEAHALLRRVGLLEIRQVAGLYSSARVRDVGTANSHEQSAGTGNSHQQLSTTMSKDPALRLATVGASLDALVEAVGASDEQVPSFDLVRDPARRATARTAYAGEIIEAFTTTYAALLAPGNGYDLNEVKRAVTHGPGALSTLLGGV